MHKTELHDLTEWIKKISKWLISWIKFYYYL
jgi:hypothetical protein